DLRRGGVEPVGVVDDAQKRFLIRDLGQQGQGCKADEETVGRIARPQAEDRPESLALRDWQPVEVIQHRRADLMKAAVGEFRLRFDSDRSREAPPVSPLSQIAQECALASASLSAKHDDSASTVERVGERRVEKLTLSTSSKQPHRLPALPRTLP